MKVKLVVPIGDLSEPGFLLDKRILVPALSTSQDYGKD